MDLTIVIVNYNVKHFIEQCLFSVFKSIKGLKVEIIVVDNASVDTSCPMIKEKFPTVTLIENKENVGFSKANNQGIKIAKGKYILLLNPDTVLQEDTLTNCYQFMQNKPTAGALGVHMINGKGRFLPESKRALPTPLVAFYKIFGLSSLFPKSKRFARYHLGYLSEHETHKVEVLSGAFMFIRKTVFEKTDMLDETFFMYGEDIDLSYRIQLAGFDNYYFAGTTIIHYKGESTKKGSINYVLVFYKAMVIFAKKHFSKKNALLYSLLIHFAVYLRASLSIIVRAIKAIFLPLADAVGIYLAMRYMAVNYASWKFGSAYYFPDTFYQYIIPSYTLLWMFGLYFWGAYEKRIKINSVIKGIGFSSLGVIVIYALLPEGLRFSRAILLLGIASCLTITTAIRFIYSKISADTKLIGKKTIHRCLINGSPGEFKRVSELLTGAAENISIIGQIDPKDKSGFSQDANFQRIKERIDIDKIDELVFCSKDVSAENIMEIMLMLDQKTIDFKIAPPESYSVIGSNSINTAGDLYVLDANALNKGLNKRKKRLFDFVTSLVLITMHPLLWFIYKRPLFALKNMLLILIGKVTWVSIKIKDNRKGQIHIKPGVLSPIDILGNKNLKQQYIDKLNVNYTKDYRMLYDLQIILKNIRDLGKNRII